MVVSVMFVVVWEMRRVERFEELGEVVVGCHFGGFYFSYPPPLRLN